MALDIGTIVSLVRKRKVSFILILLVIAGSGVTLSRLGFLAFASPKPQTETENTKKTEEIGLAPDVAVVGESTEGVDAPGTSWSGEILSLGNISIQPQREGALVEWHVRIGDRVRKGQPLATLSAPPLMPDITSMLAEKAEMLARAQAEAQATRNYAQKNNDQLTGLRTSIGNASQDSQSILTGESGSLPTAKTAVNQAKKMADSMRQSIHSFLDQIVTAHVRMVSNSMTASTFRWSNFNPGYGQVDTQNQSDYQTALSRLINALRIADILPFKEADEYFVRAVRLADTTIESPDMPDVADFRKMMRDDQNEYLEMVSKYREAEAEVAMKETEYGLMAVEQARMYAQDRKMIDEQIAENEKMTAMAQAEVKAVEISYGQVLQGLTGGLQVIAPRSGTVSTIMAKVGQFVEPGMPVATLDTGDPRERFVRFRIPGNMRLPEVGTTLTMMRPGFPQDVKKLKLLGIGTTLESGTYMADAAILEPVDWPSDASVRVSSSEGTATPLIKHSSVWWNDAGEPFVWVVSEADRIFSKKIVIGRTLGTYIEVYEGLRNGDRYIASHDTTIRENMLLEELVPKGSGNDQPAGSGGEDSMGGMDM